MSDLTIINGLRIRTNCDHPPVHKRQFDWSAWIDGQEEDYALLGRGRTESEAVSELLGIVAERDGDL
jgi:hypothetical protein